uniref:Uncharacterized protein n=1 Tax=Periophthalmus magnuspinnatus TaxID=409849 RepID=A0A3B4A325_9GOBI
ITAKVKKSLKPPSDGWELTELDQEVREAETNPHEGKRKLEALWPIFRLHHQRSQNIYDLFYKRKDIRELYHECIKVQKWKKMFCLNNLLLSITIIRILAITSKKMGTFYGAICHFIHDFL